jgi:hypothetical protein
MTRLSAYSRRRGMVLVVVLGLVSMTLGIAYVMMRTQTYDLQVLNNQTRQLDARSAARVGISSAIRKMHDDTWPGTEQSITENLDANGLSGYTISFTTGDNTLVAGNANYAEWPLRVTLVATGFAIDPANTNSRSEHSIRTVVKLSPRKFNTSALAVNNLETYSIYQHANLPARIHPPIRTTGNVMLQGTLQFSNDYPKTKNSAAYNRYYDDLRLMHQNGLGDHRPFGGTIYTPVSRQTTDLTATIGTRLNTPYVNVAANSTVPLTPPSTISSYRLYSKGKIYYPVTLPTTATTSTSWTARINAGTYKPATTTNPLGIFLVNAQSVGFLGGTSLTGCLLNYGSTTTSDIHISGSALELKKQQLPALLGDSANYLLPTAIASANIRIHDGLTRNLTGLLVANNEFEIKAGGAFNNLDLTGTVVSKILYLDGKTSWVQTNTWWTDRYNGFLAGSGLSSNYFPDWLAKNYWLAGFFLEPAIKIEAPPVGDKYFSPADWTQPIYVPLSTDGGMLWEVVSWQEPYTP